MSTYNNIIASIKGSRRWTGVRKSKKITKMVEWYGGTEKNIF